MGLREFLQDDNFLLWLLFLNKIMPHCDIVCSQLLKCCWLSRNKEVCQNFNLLFNEFRLCSILITTGTKKSSWWRGRTDSEVCTFYWYMKVLCKEVCDIIMAQINDSFLWSDHLSFTILLESISVIDSILWGTADNKNNKGTSFIFYWNVRHF